MGIAEKRKECYNMDILHLSTLVRQNQQPKYVYTSTQCIQLNYKTVCNCNARTKYNHNLSLLASKIISQDTMKMHFHAMQYIYRFTMIHLSRHQVQKGK
jgi:hypothetical protein